MRKGIAALAAVGLLTVCPTARADTVGVIDGAFSPTFTAQNQLLPGICSQAYTNTCESVAYNNWQPGPTSFDSGEAALDAWLSTTSANVSGGRIVFGYSMGAMVAYRWINDHADDPNAPSDVSFVVIGNPSRGSGGFDTVINLPAYLGPHGVPANEPWSITDIGRQYEMWTDFPSNTASPGYLLAVVNAVIGGQTLHDYTQVNPNDPSMIVWQDGNITYKLLPTPYLPIIAWTGPLAPALDDWLRPMVEDAYIRPVPVPDPTEGQTPSSLSTQVLTTSPQPSSTSAAAADTTATKQSPASPPESKNPVSDRESSTPPATSASTSKTAATQGETTRTRKSAGSSTGSTSNDGQPAHRKTRGSTSSGYSNGQATPQQAKHSKEGDKPTSKK